MLAECAPQAVSEHARVNADNLDGQIMRCAVDCEVSKNQDQHPWKSAPWCRARQNAKANAAHEAKAETVDTTRAKAKAKAKAIEAAKLT